MTVPYWVQDAVFYQIFPDRFANGDPENDPINIQPWGATPTIWNFQGGDLRGIIKRIDYLLDLGINAIYLNPIFHAASNHRYNTTDYYQIDPKLGDLADFRALLEAAHRNGIRVVIDGVFNHCGRSFFAFADVLENRENSPYKDWFHIQHFPVDAYSPGEAKDYLAWWGIKSLPKFNTSNPRVRRYIMNVARYWIEQGADGWRLDVPNEIDDDDFWAEFHDVVKSVNRDAYLVGEVWTADPRWVGNKHFDGLMHYPLRENLLKLLSGEHDIAQFAQKIEMLNHLYERQHLYAMYVPLGSHDTERLLTRLENDLEKVKLAYLFQFAFPGAPAIYYGDEVGLTGGKDPECRAAFPWEQSKWNLNLRNWVKQLVVLRKRMSVLRRGDYQTVYTDNRRRSFAFSRTLGDEAVLVVINSSATRRRLRLPVNSLGWRDGQIVRNLLGREEYLVSEDSISVTLPGWSGVWIS